MNCKSACQRFAPTSLLAGLSLAYRRRRRKRGRSVVRAEESAVVAAFRERMASEQAQSDYCRVVEFCHAWIKSKLGLRQFRVRGLAKAQMELLWVCLIYNKPSVATFPRKKSPGSSACTSLRTRSFPFETAA